ncbi:MAG: TIGR04283 family arsenosugar biosynthesis glycosyltransferase [Scytonematopsis contorta HA4267-MV1]|jgi:rSAM/selenodomain-associated transferase 2|nr:TIGR04283 family arsenosugar biosynthesis glycosyltransferase [Scytonematopsis contorta HA4267-MV1]
MSNLSIIIPTLNEATTLKRTLNQLTLLNPPVKEIIVVDGGSHDSTTKVAENCFQYFPDEIEVKLINCERSGRSIQMNHGVSFATGDTICFLHADTYLPDDVVAVIEQSLSDKRVIAGGFISLMTGLQTTRWGISLHNYLKTYYAPLLFKPHLFFQGLRLLFGDQAIFCRRAEFLAVGGFDETLPIMEEGDLCLKLCKKGQIRLVNRIVTSSDRRVAHWGAWKATAIYLYIGMLWGIGVDANYLKKFYEDIR